MICPFSNLGRFSTLPGTVFEILSWQRRAAKRRVCMTTVACCPTQIFKDTSAPGVQLHDCASFDCLNLNGGGYNDDGGMQSTHRFYCQHACYIKRFVIHGNWFRIDACPWRFMMLYAVSLECRNGSKCPPSVRSSVVWVCVSQRFLEFRCHSGANYVALEPWAAEDFPAIGVLAFVIFCLCSQSRRVGIMRYYKYRTCTRRVAEVSSWKEC